ncbi:MAG: hypothetical protein JXC33_00220 [Deltaproteobacteria bacterium]|nr:hypothetical protein [Deltaproteobacteria bacterium]
MEKKGGAVLDLPPFLLLINRAGAAARFFVRLIHAFFIRRPPNIEDMKGYIVVITYQQEIKTAATKRHYLEIAQNCR